MKKLGYIITSFILLILLSALFVWQGQEKISSLSEVKLVLSTQSEDMTLSLWQQGETYYAFLPSCADLTQVKFAHYANAKLQLDHRADDWQALALGEDYPFELVDRRGVVMDAGEICFLQSENLPSLSLMTESQTMTAIHQDKNQKESGRIDLRDAAGQMLYQGELNYIKGRGNASWLYDKRPYNIQLKEEADLLGMGKGKNWSLIANFLDESSLRNKLIYDFADQIGLAYTSHSAYVDLYLNGDYAGIYLLTEPIEIGQERVNICDLDQANEQANQRDVSAFRAFEQEDPVWQKGYLLDENPQDISGGYLIELDLDERYDTLDAAFRTKNGQTVSVKSPSYISKEEIDYLQQYINAFEQALLSADGYNKEGKYYTEYIDLDSWCKKYLIEELFENLDSGLTSQYFYKPAESDMQSSVLFAGPVWDYDWSLGNGDLSIRIVKNFHAAQVYHTNFYYSYWYAKLAEKPEFQHRLREIYAEVWPQIQSLYQKQVADEAKKIAAAWQMDKLRWSNSEKNANMVIFDTLQAHEAYLRDFLAQRSAFLYDAWCNQTKYYTLTCDKANGGRYLYYALLPNERIELPQLTMDGYRFLGWFDENGAPFAGYISEDTEIFAHWQKTETEVDL